MSTEEQLINIEIKISHHEHSINELSDVIYRQQKQIDLLEETCRQLMKKLESASEGQASSLTEHEIPPHY